MDKMLLLKAKEKNAKQKKYRISYLIGVCLLGLSVSLRIVLELEGVGLPEVKSFKAEKEATDSLVDQRELSPHAYA